MACADGNHLIEFAAHISKHSKIILPHIHWKFVLLAEMYCLTRDLISEAAIISKVCVVKLLNTLEDMQKMVGVHHPGAAQIY